MRSHLKLFGFGLLAAGVHVNCGAAQVSESDFFEVSASTLETAQSWLAKKAAMRLSQNDVELFGQKNFHCVQSKQPYLTLAKYENGNGSFHLSTTNSALLIVHTSLGHASGVRQTALVVCLDFLPTEVFSRVEGDL